MKLEFCKLTEDDFQTVHTMLDQDPLNEPILFRAWERLSHMQYLVFENQNPVAFVCAEHAVKETLLMIYVVPEFRRKGIGTSILHYFEELYGDKTQSIYGFFDHRCTEAAIFAAKYGYNRHYDFVYMAYDGEPFIFKETPPIRPYTDTDYPESQAMRAQAFHQMRVAVGDFPESQPTPPTEAGRKEWLSHADDYFLYMDGSEVVGVGYLEQDEIASLSVRIDWQGQGIGHKFAPYLINVLKQHGYQTVHLDCIIGNPAQKFYEDIGFKPLYNKRYVRKYL